MYNTTADYKTYIKKPSRSFESKVAIGERTFDNSSIIQIVLNIIQPKNGFGIGNTVSQSVDITLKNDGGVYASIGIVDVSIGLKIESLIPTIEYVPIGKFNIDSVIKTDYTVKLACYDNMIRFETGYFSDLGDTVTLRQVVDELKRLTGVDYDTTNWTIPSYSVSNLKGYTCREILGYVASVCGGNAYITRSGEFTVIVPKEISYQVTADNYINDGYKLEDQSYKIGMITCQNKTKSDSDSTTTNYDSINNQTTISTGSLSSDSMELGFINPWVTESILNDIYTKIGGFSYLGYTMKWQGDLSLDVGDLITVIDKNNTVRKAFVYANKLTYNGGLVADTSAKGETKNSNSFNTTNANTELDRISVKILIAEKAIITKANIKDLEVTNAKVENLDADIATINTALIHAATVDDLAATNAIVTNLATTSATVTQLTATNATVATLNTSVSNINSALINKANVADLTAANANISTLNTAVADIKTLVNGNLTSANIQSLVLTSSKVTVDNGFIKNAMIESLDVTKINAGTLNTNKISVSSSDGGLIIAGATQQFKDKNKKVRLQLGQDATGNFNFILRDADGTTTLIDGAGVHEKAIADKLIKTNMVADSAIGGQQINYSSFVTGLNAATNTSYIKASKVAIDLTGQSLDIAFNNMNTTVTNVQTTANSAKSSIDNLIIGGRNLLKNSPNKNNMITYTASQNDAYSFFSNVYCDLEANTKYTMSYKSDKTKSDIHAGVIGTVGIWLSNESKNYQVFLGSGKTFTVSTTQKYILRTNIYGAGIIASFWDIKIEKGNKATDWTPAPEDVDSSITSVRTITETNTTSINAIQGQISTLISNTTITTNGTTTQLKDAYNSTVNTINSMKTTIGEHTSKIDTANSNITSVTSKEAALEVSLNSISASLTSTKSTVSSHTTQISTVTTTANNANTKIDGLQIGGRNLLYNSGDFKNITNWNIPSSAFSYIISADNTLTITKSANASAIHYGVALTQKLIVNQQYTISIYAKSSVSGNIGFSLEKSTGEFLTGIGFNFPLADTYYLLTQTFTTANFDVDAARLSRSSSGDSLNHSITFKYLKLEIGNKPTDWTPAPEDTDSAISSVNATATTANTNASNAFNTANTANTTANTASTNASNAVNTANNANTTASAAKTTANNALSAANTATSNVATLTTSVSTVTSRVAAVELTTSGLATRVENTETAISTLEIGGRNLIRTSYITAYSSTISYTEDNNTWTITVANGAGGTWGAGLAILNNSKVVVPNGRNYICSFEIYTSKALNWNVDINNYAVSGTSWAGNDNDNSSLRKISSKLVPSHIWTKCWFSYTASNTNATGDIYDNSNFGLVNNTGSSLTYYIRNVKGELGNKPTDWTPAIEDVDQNIADIKTYTTTTINSNVSTIKQTTDSIKQNVNSLQSSVSTINTTLGHKADTTTVTSISNRTATLETGVKGINASITTLNSNVSTVTTTANNATTTANTAKTTAATASTDASTAKTTAATAKTTANTASTNASNAVNTANSANTTAGTAKTTANNALSAANTATNNVTALTTTVTNTTNRVTSLELTTSGLTTRVENTETAISTLEIGGRNFIKNSNFYIGSSYWGLMGIATVDTSFKYNSHNTLKLSRLGATTDNWYGAQQTLSCDCSQGKIYTASCYYYIDDISKLDYGFAFEMKGKTSSGDIQICSYPSLTAATAISKKWTRINYTFTINRSDLISIFAYPWIRRNGVVWFADFKLESGTQDTDWTPAIEDVDQNIADVKTYATTTINSNVSTINQTTDSIKQNVSSLQSSVSTINTTLGHKADTTTVTSISNRTATLETGVKGINASITTLNSNVSSVTTTANAAKNSIDNLQVGGRNLLLKTGIKNGENLLSSIVGTSVTCTIAVIDESTAPYGKAITLTRTDTTTNSGGRYWTILALLTSGNVYSWSVWLKGTGIWQVGQEQGGSKSVTLTTTWTKYTYTFTASSSAYHQFIFYRNGGITGGYLSFHSLKLELGNKATDWTPAPEDIDSQITTINTSVNSAQSAINVLKGQIALKVEQTQINTAVATLDGKITTTNSKVSSLQTSINLQLDSITSKVNKTVSTKNLVNNPAFNNPLGIHWSNGTLVHCLIVDNYTGWGYGSAPVANDNVLVIRYDVGGDNYVVFKELYANVKPNTTYTISYYYVMNGYYTEASSYIYAQTAAQIGTSDYTTPYVIGPDQRTARNVWIRKTSTITTGSNVVRLAFRFGFHSTNGLTEMLIAGLQIEEGSTATDWTDSANSVVGTSIIQSPTNVMTAFNGIGSYFQITESEAKIGNLVSGAYTKMSLQGLEHVDGYGSMPYHYYSYMGWATIAMGGETSKEMTFNFPQEVITRLNGTIPRGLASVEFYSIGSDHSTMCMGCNISDITATTFVLTAYLGSYKMSVRTTGTISGSVSSLGYFSTNVYLPASVNPVTGSNHGYININYLIIG